MSTEAEKRQAYQRAYRELRKKERQAYMAKRKAKEEALKEERRAKERALKEERRARKKALKEERRAYMAKKKLPPAAQYLELRALIEDLERSLKDAAPEARKHLEDDLIWYRAQLIILQRKCN